MGGGAHKVSYLQFSHFVAPFPIINDQSLYTMSTNDSLNNDFSTMLLLSICHWENQLQNKLVLVLN